jgi:hypothetical protein
MPDFSLTLDTSGDGSYATDITTRIVPESGLAWQRGNDQLREFSPVSAGDLTAILRNIDRLLSPGNMSSSLYGLLIPGTLNVRLTTVDDSGGGLETESGEGLVTEGGDALSSEDTPGRIIWTGSFDDLTHDPAFGVKTASFRALGSISKLRGRVISTGLFQNQTTGQLLNAILDEAGWPAEKRDIDDGNVTVAYYAPDKGDAAELAYRIKLTEGVGSGLYEDGAGNIVFRSNTWRTTSPRSTVSQYIFSDLINLVSPLDYSSNYKDRIESVRITQQERSPQALSVLWTYSGDLTLAPNAETHLEVRGSDMFLGAVEPSPFGTDEIQTLTPTKPLTSGTFIADYKGQRTGALNWNDSAATIQAALEGLSTIGSGNILVLGSLSTFLTVVFTGALKAQAVDLLTIISTLNPGLQAVGVNVVDTDGFQTSYTMYPTATPTLGIWKAKTRFGNETGNLTPTQSAAGLEGAFNALPGISPGDVTVGGGPFPAPLNVTWLIPTDLSVVTTTLTAPTEPTAFLTVARTVVGGGPDYVISAGSATFALDRTNGASCTLTITADSLGVTLSGLQVRAQLITVVRTNEIVYPATFFSSTSGASPDAKFYKPDVIAEISLTDAQSIAQVYYLHYKDERPTAIATVMPQGLDSSDLSDILQLEIGDRVTLVCGQLGISEDHFIEHISSAIVGQLVHPIFGLERAA